MVAAAELLVMQNTLEFVRFISPLLNASSIKWVRAGSEQNEVKDIENLL